jgi:hypothetical protein
VRTVAKFLGVKKSYVFNNLRNEGRVTIGAVWDYRCKKMVLPTAREFDNLTAWSQEHQWPLSAGRRSALRFMRTAWAARIAGVDLSTASVTARTLLRWGVTAHHQWRWATVNKPYYEFWRGRARTERIRYGKKKTVLRVWKVSDLLDWFIVTAEPETIQAATKQGGITDELRNCYRNVAKNLFGSADGLDTWEGASRLQKAWSWYWRMLDAAVGQQPGKRDIMARKLVNYLAKALSDLAAADPDWTRPPLDTSTIKPRRFYPVWIPPGRGARTDVIHAPATAQLLQILGDQDYWSDAECRDAARRFGIDTGRVANIRGSDIIARPYAYTR